MGLDIYFNKVKRSEIKYFRKVNFLVKFFEDQLGREIQNCSPVIIDKNMCEELKNRCIRVLNHHEKAAELLPTQEGFFFGNTDYDEYYYKDVQEVYEFIDGLIDQFEDLTDKEDIEFCIWY